MTKLIYNKKIFSKNFIKDINERKKIYIIGRGPSARFFVPSKKKISVGFNLLKIKKGKLNYIYSKEKINIAGKKNIKVGSVNFFLYDLLSYINLKKKTNGKLKVYLYGFDFRKISHDDDLEKIKIKKDRIQQLIDVNSQLIAFNYIKEKFNKLKIIRIGFGINSDLSPKNINLNNQKKIISNKLKIVAEVTTNHQGSTNTLKKLILGCIKAGIKNIKFQKRDVKNFYNKKILNKKYLTPISKTFGEYRNKLELNEKQIDLIKYYKKKYKINVIFSVLDYVSYKYLKKKGFKLFKIPSTISNHKNYINKISKENINELIISTGMTNEKYIKFIIKKFKKVKKLYLLHAVSCYPTEFENINLKIIRRYSDLSKKYKNIVPGYSSHDIGDLGCMLAVASGAEMIEKHIKTGITPWMHFDDTAIDVDDELPIFVSKLEKVYNSQGNYKKKIQPFEHHKYK